MTEEELKKNIAHNITSLRKNGGMTQAELAEKLNYSDKSVSKWERGDGVPDILVLHKISELFGVTLNEIIGEEIVIKKEKKLPHMTNRIIIPLLSVGLVFLVASIVFLMLKIFLPSFPKAWILYILALPVSCIPLLVFAEIWWEIPQRFLCVSALIWSVVLFLCLSFENENMNFAVITAAIFQVITILWFIMRYRSKKRKQKAREQSENKSNNGSD